MDWVKIPKEHHPLFLSALPDDPRISTMKLFGGIGAAVNGNMFAALWAKSVMMRLSASDYQRAVDDLGAIPFDPMNRGKPRENAAVFPDNLIGETKELRSWLVRALNQALTLPPKDKAEPAAKKKARASSTKSAKGAAKKAKPSRKAATNKKSAKKKSSQ